MEYNENNQHQQAGLMILSQYIKDMSLEIPLAPQIFKEMTQAPNVQVEFNMKHEQLEDGNFNVTLNTKLDANVGEKKLFIIELAYAAVASVNVPQEHLEPVLEIELPRLLFPFVRSIISHSLSEAGLPPMMLSPIDFVSLYNAKKAKQAEAQKTA